MPPRLECQTSRRESNAAAGRGEGLAGCRLGGAGFVRADLQVLCKKSGATVLLGNGDPAAGLASDLPLGRLHRPPGARCLARRAIMFFEFAESPAQRGSLPTSTANTTRRDAGVVECRLGLLTTFRATPSHPADSTDHRDVARSLSRLPDDIDTPVETWKRQRAGLGLDRVARPGDRRAQASSRTVWPDRLQVPRISPSTSSAPGHTRAVQTLGARAPSQRMATVPVVAAYLSALPTPSPPASARRAHRPAVGAPESAAG